MRRNDAQLAKSVRETEDAKVIADIARLTAELHASMRESAATNALIIERLNRIDRKKAPVPSTNS